MCSKGSVDCARSDVCCLQSYQRRKAFIACQAPLENTVDDFWRMIWQHRSPIIVVLTQLMEQGVVCLQTV